MNRTALDTYINRLGMAEQKIERIKLYIDDHGEVAPDDVTWADVGEMERLLSALDEIYCRIEEVGEYAS